MQKLIIFGTGVTGRNVYEFVTKYNLFNVVAFTVNQIYVNDDEFMGKPIVPFETLSERFHKGEVVIFVAIQWNRLNSDRRRAYNMVKSAGYKMVNLVSPTAIVNGELVGDNCWIADRVTIDFGSKVESDCFLKIGAAILNDTIVHSHCFIAGGALVAGECEIGSQSFIGLNTTILDGTNVGEKCLIGACGCVRRHVPDFSKVTYDGGGMKVVTYDSYEIENKLISSKNVR